CGYLGDTGNPEDFRWGFLAAGIGMCISLVLFISLKNKYIVTPEGVQIGEKPNSARDSSHAYDSQAEHVLLDAPANKKSSSYNTVFLWLGVFAALFGVFHWVFEMDIIGCFIFSLTIAAPGYIISDPTLTKIERERIWVIYIVAFFVIFFWSAFEQAGASLTYFAEEQTNRSLFGTIIPASYFQSINAVAIVIFAPLFVLLWSSLGKKNLEPASPYKQAVGLFLLAVGYLIIAFGVKGLESGVKVSMIWLISLYTIHTFGELCLSPIGLSMVNKLAPVKFASLLMGVWFLSTSAANKFAGTLSALYPEPVVAIEMVHKVEDESQLKLFPDGFDESKASQINNTAVIPMEKIKLSRITDENKKQEVAKFFEENQIPNVKKFAGLPIKDLYDFFMLFVFMAGAASIVLFILSKKMLKMMHDVR
ncbi:MAG: MFS transporter, partial [Crocinitomicaceae bacterium]|nr:MFS transporter [Crocinitomicaceae bacterium]